MSRNFSWFLRFVIYIPLATLIVIMGSYSYLTHKFESNLEACLNIPSIVPSPTDRRKVVPFVGCLKKKSNFFLTKMMDENRLYQYAYPKVPCQFVGKWHVSADVNEYWQTINADATFSKAAIQYGKNLTIDTQVARTGLWSSITPETAIQFFDEEPLWPINQGSVDWLTENEFALHTIREGAKQTAYYHRHSPLDATCVVSK